MCPQKSPNFFQKWAKRPINGSYTIFQSIFITKFCPKKGRGLFWAQTYLETTLKFFFLRAVCKPKFIFRAVWQTSTNLPQPMYEDSFLFLVKLKETLVTSVCLCKDWRNTPYAIRGIETLQKKPRYAKSALFETALCGTTCILSLIVPTMVIFFTRGVTFTPSEIVKWKCLKWRISSIFAYQAATLKNYYYSVPPPSFYWVSKFVDK